VHPGTKQKQNHHLTFCHDRFVLLYYLFLVGPADFCLEIPFLSSHLGVGEKLCDTHFRAHVFVGFGCTILICLRSFKASFSFYFLRFLLRRNGLSRERWSLSRWLVVIPSAVRIYSCDHCIISKHTNYKSSHFTHHCLLHFINSPRLPT
jgi:hypothetical protein